MPHWLSWKHGVKMSLEEEKKKLEQLVNELKSIKERHEHCVIREDIKRVESQIHELLLNKEIY